MNPSQPRLLRVEAVADLPVLWATFQRLDLPATLDRHFPAPLHWRGPLTPGEVLAVWLLLLVSQGDHCLNHLEPWVAQHQGVITPPTMLRTSLLGAPFKRGGTDSIHDANLLLVDLDFLHQGPDDLPARGP